MEKPSRLPLWRIDPESDLNRQGRENNTPPENSVGLFQLNINGGVGSGHVWRNLRSRKRTWTASLGRRIRFLSSRPLVDLHDAVAVFCQKIEQPANQAGEINQALRDRSENRQIAAIPARVFASAYCSQFPCSAPAAPRSLRCIMPSTRMRRAFEAWRASGLLERAAASQNRMHMRAKADMQRQMKKPPSPRMMAGLTGLV